MCLLWHLKLHRCYLKININLSIHELSFKKFECNKLFANNERHLFLNKNVRTHKNVLFNTVYFFPKTIDIKISIRKISFTII